MCTCTCVNGDVEEFGDEVAVVVAAPGEEEGAAVRLGEEAHVDEDLVAEHVDVQLVGHVSDQLHEHLPLLHLLQHPAPLHRVPTPAPPQAC